MKILHYALGMTLVLSGIDSIFTTRTSLYACPRCRRALPKGPLKHPHPGFPKKERNQSYSMNNTNDNPPKRDLKEKLHVQK